MPGPRHVERPDLPGQGANVSGSSGVDPALDRVTLELEVVLAERDRLSRRDPDLLFDQVDPGDHLGHRVLDLDPRIHLDEVELARRVEEELDRARR